MAGHQALDTKTVTSRLMLTVIGAVGYAEREGMLERQREGIAKAKPEGRYRGRVPTARATGRRDEGRGHQTHGNRGQAGDWSGQRLSGAG